MRVMVTGGTGYIGAHTSVLLAERGDDVLIVDDVRTGAVDRVPDIPLMRLDLASDGARDVLTEAFRSHAIDAVIHFAARKQVGESMENPAWYYQQNIGGLANLMIAMERAEVGKLVFSSSAAVYGEADGAIAEDVDLVPVNPYGATKLAGEQLIEASVRVRDLAAASLRYFNVGGAGRPELGDTEALNLIPIVLEHLDADRRPEVFGTDYDTSDGSCIRDYVHVMDVAEAHLAVLDRLDRVRSHRVYNVGTGVGTSVLEMVSMILEQSGSDLEIEVKPRRAGDAASVVARVERIRDETGWEARFGLEEIVRSAVQSRAFLAALSDTTRA